MSARRGADEAGRARLGHRDPQPALAQRREHELGERPLVLGEDRVAEPLAQARDERVERRRGAPARRAR